MIVLGIETSCDETGVAIFSSESGLLAERLASQHAIHAPFGGVVPELASRDHIRLLAPMVSAALREASISVSDLDAVAYTAGPGLIGALMVGASLGAALAFALRVPAIPINHMEGHLLASMLGDDAPSYPFLALLVSGGHSQLVAVESIGKYRILGETLDDAAGEAFDKVARLLDLEYPGGPALARLAEEGSPEAYDFPRPMLGKGLDLSFSGLKTAVRLAIEEAVAEAAPEPLAQRARADIAAAFQAAVVDTLVAKSRAALAESGLRRLVVAGGVGANARLRAAMKQMGRADNIWVSFPRPSLCTDNAAMIAYAGACRLNGAQPGRPEISARPRWPVDELQPPRDH